LPGIGWGLADNRHRSSHPLRSLATQASLAAPALPSTAPADTFSELLVTPYPTRGEYPGPIYGTPGEPLAYFTAPTGLANPPLAGFWRVRQKRSGTFALSAAEIPELG
jgi:hypothetical protein